MSSRGRLEFWRLSGGFCCNYQVMHLIRKPKLSLHAWHSITSLELVDRDFARCDGDENYVLAEASIHQPHTWPIRDDSALMNAFRDSITLGLLNRSWQLEWWTSNNVTCESIVLFTTMLCTWTIYAKIYCDTNVWSNGWGISGEYSTDNDLS